MWFSISGHSHEMTLPAKELAEEKLLLNVFPLYDDTDILLNALKQKNLKFFFDSNTK